MTRSFLECMTIWLLKDAGVGDEASHVKHNVCSYQSPSVSSRIYLDDTGRSGDGNYCAIYFTSVKRNKGRRYEKYFMIILGQSFYLNIM